MTQAEQPRAGAPHRDTPAPCQPDSMGDDVEIVPDAEEGVVRVRGELDADTVDEVRECLNGLARTGTGRLVVDLAGVRSIDWNGIGVLIGARERVRRQGGELVLRSCPDEADQLLDRSGMRDLFTIES